CVRDAFGGGLDSW
nr:immunoglobulin heavy chain junction region [Macaca mulatta]MOW45695.1 immunoglobulin heavy chain junction region [Macaca mulatta]MOW45757.1 immunoglobulin heavy chain junction region [Macaca mulatta]MOW45806.1 immunoglobulin heavy chain junction region [Macaca mulatta]MOW46165.1 immunoglobulin heavy chain junction region [Macaca mulatta]